MQVTDGGWFGAASETTSSPPPPNRRLSPGRRFEVVLRVVDRVADLGADIATVHAQVDRWEKKTRKPSPPLNEKFEDSSPSSGQPSVDSVGKSKS